MGYGPPFITLAPRTVRYKRAHVLAWLEQRKHQSTGEYRPRHKRARGA
jgi:hypothetical protein